MYGYLRVYSKDVRISAYNGYASYYCGLCLYYSYKFNRFSLARFLTNHDIAILAMILDAGEKEAHNCGHCGKYIPNKGVFDCSFWDKIGLINYCIFANKIYDDSCDEKNKKFKLQIKLWNVVFFKYRHNHRETIDRINLIMHEYWIIERQQKSFDSLINAFSKSIEDIFSNQFPERQNECKLIAKLIKWIYFADAIDDYYEDTIAKHFNPLESITKRYNPISRKDFFDCYIGVLINIYNSIYNEIVAAYEIYRLKEHPVLDWLIFHSIPKTFKEIVASDKKWNQYQVIKGGTKKWLKNLFLN